MKKSILRYFILIVGSAIAAFALEEFLVPCKILDGGIVGISIIISTLTALPLSALTMCLNIPFVIIGSKRLGRSFLLRTVVSMISFSIFLEIFSRWRYDATNDELLATVFGGMILGLGVGLIIRNGGLFRWNGNRCHYVKPENFFFCGTNCTVF